MSYWQNCCCALPECMERGCIQQRRSSALPSCWPVVRHPEAPPLAPEQRLMLAPPSLGYRYRFEKDGAIIYERDPSFSFSTMTSVSAA